MLLERRSAQPLTPLWVFADRNRGGAHMIQALVGGALFGMFFLTTLFLQHVLGYSPLKAGAAFVPATMVMMGAARAMSRLVNRTGVRPLVATGTAIAAAGMWWLSHLHLHAGYLTGVMLPLMVLSVGLGLTFVPLTLTAVSGVQRGALRPGVRGVDHRHPDRRFHRRRRTRHRRRHYRPPPRRSAGAAALAAGYTQAFRVGAVIIALAVPLALVFLRLRPGGPPAVPRRRLLTRWCPVSATVTERRDAPGRRMVLPAPPHRADRLASPVLARRDAGR